MERFLFINVSWPSGFHLTPVRLYKREIQAQLKGDNKNRACNVCWEWGTDFDEICFRYKSRIDWCTCATEFRNERRVWIRSTIDNLVNEVEDQKCDTCSYNKTVRNWIRNYFWRRERGNLKSFKFSITLRGFWYAVRLALGLITHLNVNVAYKS